jgi:glutathione peroxidase
VRDIEGQETSLSIFTGRVLLIVNSASKCGFTPPFAGLKLRLKSHSAKGLIVRGFPSRQFGTQVTEDNEKIAQFCELNDSENFRIMAKIDVDSVNADPPYKQLADQAPRIFGTKSIHDGIPPNFYLAKTAGYSGATRR